MPRFLELAARALMLAAYGSANLNRAYASIARSADTNNIRNLRDTLQEARRREPVSAAKYSDFRLWLVRNLHRAAQLGLQRAPGMRVMDIGAGPGYFIAVARALGHTCLGVDLPPALLSPLERRVYGQVLNALNCREYVEPLVVQAFTRLEVAGGPFDLITAFLVCFNRHKLHGEWGIEEWRFFIEDAMSMLRPGGRLYLGLNENRQRYGDLRFYDQPLLAYFRSVGSVSDARIMVLKR